MPVDRDDLAAIRDGLARLVDRLAVLAAGDPAGSDEAVGDMNSALRRATGREATPEGDRP